MVADAPNAPKNKNKGIDFWAFGSADDDTPDTPEETPPGFKIQRGIPMTATFGHLLVCRACGAVVGPRPANIQDHTEFHDTLAALVDNSLRMRYTVENPKVVPLT